MSSLRKTISAEAEIPVDPPPTPAPGEAAVANNTAASFGTNSEESVRPSAFAAGTWQYSLWDAFGAGVMLPDYGTHGAYVVAGTGGHQAPENVDGVIFDFADYTWKYRPNTNGVPPHPAPFFVADTNGFPYYEITGTQVPTPSHTYNYASGWGNTYFMPISAATCWESVNSRYSHTYTLGATTGTWARAGTNSPITDAAPNWGQYGGIASCLGAYDKLRHRVWWFHAMSHWESKIPYYDIATNTWGAITCGTLTGDGGGEGTLIYDAEQDRIWLGNTTGLYYANLSGYPNVGWNAVSNTGLSSFLSTFYRTRWDRFPVGDGGDGCFYTYSGTGGNVLRRFNPHTRVFDTTTVANGVLTPSGSTFQALVNGAYSRFFYVPSRKSFCWIPGNGQQVVLVRPQPQTVSVAADWAYRSSGPGVIKSVDFGLNPGAINKFALRDPGTPTSWMQLDATAGIRGAGAMRQYCQAGSSNRHKWVFPFSPFPADATNSLPPDRGFISGRGGNPTGVAWPYTGEAPNATNYMRWRYGLYGHSAYWATTREWVGSTPWEWIQKPGSTSRDFWIQVRTKMGPTFFTAGTHAANSYRGKHIYIDLCGGGNGELVSFAPAGRISGSTVDRRSRFYTNFNGYDLEEMIDGGGVNGRVQPGSPYANTCIADQFNGSNACWWMPENEWFTMLFHVIPGRTNDTMLTYQYNPRAGYLDATTTNKDTQVEIYAHRRGETGYTLIHRRLLSNAGANDAYAWAFQATAESNYSASKGPKGFNELEINAYMGSSNLPADASWERWYDQIIFSHEFIPCPVDGEG